MRYLLAFIVPPLAVLMCGRSFHFVVNLVFWLVSIPLIFFMGVGLLVWLICTIHAIVICMGASADKRVNRLVQAIDEQRQQHAADAR